MAHRAPPRYRSSHLVFRLRATVTSTYDRADQAIQQTISGVDTAFAYNAWGDLTSAADRDNGVTTHAYDAGGRMVSLTPPGATPATYTYDALGRPATRSIASASLTYAYIGTTPRSYATIPNAGSATYALIDADASRLALDTGGTTAWTTFDPHGNLAATTAAGSATIVSALRSDAYGARLDSYTAGSGATEVPWRYQDRLDLSPDPDEPLYDAGARRYRPSLGAFTALDTYAGSAINPLSLNRYLYAHANPTSLIDPTGHCVVSVCADGVPIPTRGANHAVQMAAAQAQIADAASWAPASATSGPAAGSTVVPGPAVTGDIGASADLPFQRFDRALAFMTLEMQRNSQIEWVVAGREAAATQCGVLDFNCTDPRIAVWLDTLETWISLVRPDGYWDHKWRLNQNLDLDLDESKPREGDAYFPIRGNDRYELRYDVWSNIHYGYVGRAAGFSAADLIIGQLFVGRTDEADIISVSMGIDLWQTHGSAMTADDLHFAILDAFAAWEASNSSSRVLVPHSAGNWR